MRLRFGLWLLSAGLVAAALPLVAATQERKVNLLVFSRTLEFRHGSIEVGIEMLRQVVGERGWDMTATEDPTIFTDAGLAPFDAVVFLSTSGNFLDDGQQAAFERYIQAGGASVGIHAASAGEYEWPWFGQLIGAFFLNHPAQQTADITVEDDSHASTRHLPATWTRYDEWYNFRTNPSTSVTVLLRLDEQSYNPGSGAMGEDHPIAWYHTFDGGRSFYTALGHTDASFTSDTLFRQHVVGGIEWATGLTDTMAGPDWTEYAGE